MKRPLYLSTLSLVGVGVVLLMTTGVGHSQSWFVKQKCIRCDLTRVDLAHRNLQSINSRH
jgi:hypothetical protein